MGKIDVILSSAKPFSGCDYDNSQRRAILSWREVCETRVMFNAPEDIELLGDSFVTHLSNPPSIKDMLEVGMELNPSASVFAIVNSDIILSKEAGLCSELANDNHLGLSWAATSFRWEGGHIRGQGLDFFVMTVPVINQMLRDIPTFMTIGRTLWDNWMNAWLRANLRVGRYFDMTNLRCVNHNPHPTGSGIHIPYTEDQVKQIFAAGRLDCRGVPATKYLPRT